MAVWLVLRLLFLRTTGLAEVAGIKITFLSFLLVSNTNEIC